MIDTVLDIIIRACTLVGDAVFAVLSPLSPLAILCVLSAVTGVLMLLVWRHTSNQKAIADCRRQIAASLLATRLFRDNLAVTFRAQRQIVWLSLKLLALAVKPTLIMLIPFTLVMTQIGLRFESTPALVGRPVRVTASMRPEQVASRFDQAIELPDGLTPDPQDPCCADALRTIDWRITPTRADRYIFRLHSETGPIDVPLVVGEGLVRLSKQRGGSWFGRLLFSAEPSIPASSAFESVTIHYPARSTPIQGFDMHWLISLLVLSIVFALVFKPILKVHL